MFNVIKKNCKLKNKFKQLLYDNQYTIGNLYHLEVNIKDLEIEYKHLSNKVKYQLNQMLDLNNHCYSYFDFKKVNYVQELNKIFIIVDYLKG